MDFCQLNRTEIRVSRLCFGTMTFGKPVDQFCATRMIERSIEAGINFVDTANGYQHGIAESMLGNALRGKRKELVLATKVHHKMGDGPDGAGLSKRAIFRAVEESLRRLQTDYLDIYYLHEPDYERSDGRDPGCDEHACPSREDPLYSDFKLRELAGLRNAVDLRQEQIPGTVHRPAYV